MKKEAIKKEGVVTEALPNTTFKVVMVEDQSDVLAHLSGKMRMYHVRVMPGDRVLIEFSEYDQTKGRIVQRFNK
jgi:translation initiation factor IF-1